MILCPFFRRKEKRLALVCHILLVGFDHLLHHLTAYGAGLTAGQIAVISLLEVYADLGSCLHFEAIHCRACFRYHALIRTIFRVSHVCSLLFDSVWCVGFC